MGTRDANRNPRRWVDESRRVRVVEGWHPSRPSRIGYNVLVDDDWLGTFETLDDAAAAASIRARFRGLRIQDGNVVLSLVPDPSGPRGRPAQANLHPVRDPDAETED